MVAIKNNPMNVMALAAVAQALTSSPAATQSGCMYNVAGVGSFNTKMSHDWSTGSFTTVSDLNSSTYTVAAGNSPYARRFDIANIGAQYSNPCITLTVPGGQTTGPISSSQIVTSYNDILYGSVRTIAMISSVAGTTHGFSFYSSDTQEVDFAFLTSNTALAHFTNEQVNSSSPSTSYSYTAPSDATTAWHEYRVDWIPGQTMFYIDGVNVQNITGNVPSTPGFWLWNNWSNGNAWAAGPPKSDSVLKIQGIQAYFNRTSVSDTLAANPSNCASYVAPSSTSSTKSSSVTSSTKATSVSSSSTKASSTTTSATASSTPFYIEIGQTGTSADGKYVVVGSGQGGVASFVSKQSSATVFYIDSNGDLIEKNPTSGYAMNLASSSTSAQKVSWNSLSSNVFGFGNCYIDTAANPDLLVCNVNNTFYYAITCNADGYLYFATSLPSNCQYAALYPISS